MMTITEYLTTLSSPHTRRAYGRDLRDFALWFRQTNGEEATPGTITHADLQEWRAYLIRRYRPKTVNRKLAAVRAYLAWAYENGLSDAPPPRVRGAREQTRAPKWLTRREEMRLLREAEHLMRAAERGSDAARFRAVRNWALVTVMLHTGLRVSEVVGLRLTDLERNARTWWLRVQGKGGKERRVPLNARARKALERWLHERSRVVAASSESDALFVGRQGGPLNPATIRRIVADLARRAGVQATPHSLRHTFAKRLLDTGVSLEKVAALLGHENLNTTRIYLEPGERDLEMAVEALAP